MSQNIKSQRFDEMDESAKWMIEEVEVFRFLLNQYRIFDDGKLEQYCLDYLISKIGNKPLRSYFSRKIYEYLLCYKPLDPNQVNFPDTLFLKKLPFLFELVITIQYLHNQVLDEKFGVRYREKINQNLIASNILRELSFKYIEQEIEPLLQDDLVKIRLVYRQIRQLLLYVDFGQRLDKEYNHYKAYKKGLPAILLDIPILNSPVREALESTYCKACEMAPKQATFLQAYFQRIYLSNVYFFQCIAEINMALMDYTAVGSENIRQFSIQYGFMLQIINDYADFAYSPKIEEQAFLETSGKKTTDIFSDLRNLNITLPLIFHLEENARRKIEKYLESKNKRILMDYPREIKNEIVDSGAIRNCIELSRHLASAAKECLDTKNPIAPFIVNMFDIAYENKFYQVFKKQ